MPHETLRRVIVCMLAVVAVCINLSWIHQRHDADSLLTTLISIERWSPYYWGDNRFGMLLPLIASTVRSYVPNLLVQTQISIAAALLTVVLFQCFFLCREPGLSVRNLAASCLAIVIAMAIFRPQNRVIQVFLLPSHPYFTSLALGLLALVVLFGYSGRPVLRYSIAALALLASFWVNWTNGPVIAAAAFLRGRTRGRIAAVLLVCTTWAAMYSYSLLYPRLVVAGMATISEALNSISRLAVNVAGDMLHPWRALVLVVVGLAIQWRKKNVEAGILVGIAVVFAIAVGSTEWVIRNYYEWRYWTVPMALIFLIAASCIADSTYVWLERLTGSPQRAALIAMLVLAAATVRVFGVPSLSAARAGIDSVSRAHYANVERLGCTHMLGDYWVAWSSVFFNRSQKIQPPLWAISLRSEVTEDLWSKAPATARRYCGVCGDPMNNYYIIVFRLGALRHTGQADNLCLFEH